MPLASGGVERAADEIGGAWIMSAGLLNPGTACAMKFYAGSSGSKPNRAVNFLSSPAWSLLFASLLFGGFVTFMPWEWVSGGTFPDLKNYEWYIDALRNGATFNYRYDYGAVSYLSNEYAWHFILSVIAGSGFPSRQGLMLLTFLSSIAFYLFLGRRVGLVWAAVFLCNPLVISLLYAQLRSAIAMSIIFILLDIAKKKWIRVLSLIAPFVHISSIVIISIISFVQAWVSKIKWNTVSVALLFMLGTALGILLAIFSGEFLDSIGDRRSVDQYQSSGVLYTIYWLLFPILLCALALSKNLNKEAKSYVAMSIVIVQMAAVSTLLGIYGLRFVAMTFPAVAIAARRVDYSSLPLATSSLVLYQCFLWLYWTIL